MNKKRVLITGASGFIGQFVLREIVKNEKLDFFTIDTREIPNIDTKKQELVSLLDKEKLTEVIKKYSPDIVVHLAAIASVTHENIGEIYNVNVQGTENLLEIIHDYCNKDTRVILASTAGVYGNQEVERYKEDLPYIP